MLVLLPSLQVTDSPHKHGLENIGRAEAWFPSQSRQAIKTFRASASPCGGDGQQWLISRCYFLGSENWELLFLFEDPWPTVH